MPIPIVITTANLKPDGFIYVTGTVNGGATVSASVQLTQVVSLSIAQIQIYLALLLAIAAGVAGQRTELPLASLETTVDV
jgi:hypothetical protein